MNDITKELFSLIQENSATSFEKIELLWKLSEEAKKSALPNLAVDVNAAFTQEKVTFTLLTYAIHCKNSEALYFLIEKGLAIHQGTPSPLQCAVQQNLKEVILY